MATRNGFIGCHTITSFYRSEDLVSTYSYVILSV